MSSPRPTRTVLIVPDEPDVLGVGRRCGAQLLGRLDDHQGLVFLLLQNDAAAQLCPTDPCPLIDVIEHRPVDAVLQGTHGLEPRARYTSSLAGATSSVFPFLGGTADAVIPGLLEAQPRLTRFFACLRRHDPYVGLLGLLPRGFPALLGWAYQQAGATQRAAGKAADMCARELRTVLLDGAFRAYKYSDRVRVKWWQHMDAEVLAVSSARATAYLRRRARLQRITEFAAWEARAKAKAQHRYRRSEVARLLGISVPSLLGAHPEWKDRVPAPHAHLVNDLPAQVRFTRTLDGRLRSNAQPRILPNAADRSDLSTSSDEYSRGRQNRALTSLPGQVHTLFSHRRRRRRSTVSPPVVAGGARAL